MSYLPKSKSDVHITPDRVWEIIDLVWDINKVDMFDPCPLNPKFNGLTVKWKDLNYVNPPYPLTTEFVIKAFMELVFHGHETIMLLPAKTDQTFFHMLQGLDIVWIKGRLHFKNDEWSSPQAHFLVKIK